MIITYINDVIESVIHIPPVLSGSGSSIFFNEEITKLLIIIDEKDNKNYYQRCILALNDLPYCLKNITFQIKKDKNNINVKKSCYNSKYTLDDLKNKLKLPFDCELCVVYN